jgi:hypothetical protein
LIEYRGVLSEDDYVDVCRLRRTVWPEAGTFKDARLWLAVGFTLLAAYGYGVGGNSESLWWLPFSLLCVAFWWRGRVDPRRQYRETPALREEHSGRVEDNVLAGRLLGEEARVPWQFFTSYVESRSTLLLVVGERLYVVLARAFFADTASWGAACALVRAKVPPRDAGRRSPAMTVVAWLGLLLFVFLAWHFASMKRL